MKSCLAALAIVVVLFVIVSLAGVTMTGNATATPRAPDELDACLAAQQFVERALKAPATARFPACGREPLGRGITVKSQATPAGDHWSPTGHTVTGYVDSQNSFGAMLRSTYVVQMLYDPGSRKWHLQELSFAP